MKFCGYENLRVVKISRVVKIWVRTTNFVENFLVRKDLGSKNISSLNSRSIFWVQNILGLEKFWAFLKVYFMVSNFWGLLMDSFWGEKVSGI